MEEKIIPEKEPLFQPKIKPREKIPQRAKPIPQQSQPDQVQFNIPTQPQIQPQSQPAPEQAVQQTESKKITGWKKWAIIVAVILIVVGLGFYFLAG